MKIITLEQIKAALPSVDLMGEIEAGFVAYSKGQAVVPPVGELVLTDPPGEVHIKYGYLSDDDYYVRVLREPKTEPALEQRAHAALQPENRRTGRRFA